MPNREADNSTKASSGNSGDGDRYVLTKTIRDAVSGHETEVLKAVGIDWPGGKGHIDCPYSDHGSPGDWRWDDRKDRAFCTCIGRRPGEHKSHGIFDVVMVKEDIDFEAAKIRVAEAIGRSDLIRVPGKHQAMDAASLLSPPSDNRDDRLPVAYLAHRLGVEPTEVPKPRTRMVGIKALGYFDPPISDRGKPQHVGDFPCAVFEMVDVHGRRHAHRIYLAPGGAGKAALGKRADGKERDPKKSAKVQEGDNTSGRCVVWGDPSRASHHLIVAEGIENAAPYALAYPSEIETGSVVVLAGISANGVEAVEPYPLTERITVAADRDEGVDERGRSRNRRGEKAARALGLAQHGRIPVSIALPGEPDTKTDWLDIFRRGGADAVRAGIEAAEPFMPTADEMTEREDRKDRAAELTDVIATYPLPDMMAAQLRYSHTADGRVWLHKYTGIDKLTGEEQWTPIATPFGVPALLRYADQADAYGLRVLVQDMAGRPRAIDLERGALARMGGSDIKAKLFEAGLRVEQDGDSVAVTVLKAAEPTAEIVVVSRPGWHRLPRLDPIFVAPSGTVLGLPDGFSLELSVNARLAEPVVAGTFSGWRKAVEAAVAVQNCPHWIIGTVAAFAGPILGLTGLDTCGVNLSGLSSGGKTTAQRLAVSAWSSPRVGEALLQSMRTTENAVEALAQRSSGTVLALDEMGHADGKAVGRLIYSIAGGIGKARMTAAAILKGPYSWATFTLISGECSLEEKVRQDGGQWMAGMAVRIADIDVTAVNRTVSQTTFDVINDIFENYGHAGPAFLQALVAAGMQRHPDALRERVNRAAGQLAGTGADSARIRAALPFGLLLVAGELAKTFAILPETTTVSTAVQWAWGRFTESSDALALDPAEQAINNIRQWIAERWGVSIRHTEVAIAVREAVAWFDADTVYLPTKRIREAGGDALKEGHIVKVLNERGLLSKRADEKRLTVKYVPNVGHVQCYALPRSVFGRPDESDKQSGKPAFTVHEGNRR